MEPLDLASVAVRAAAFIAALQAAGLVWFAASIVRSAPAGMPCVIGLARVSAALALVLVVMHGALDAARLAGEWSGMLDPHLQYLAWSRRPGLSSLVCSAGLLAALAGLSKSNQDGIRLAILGAFVVVGSFELTGHATEATHPVVVQLLLVLHVSLAAYWIGAVAGLYWLTGHAAPGDVTRAAAHFSGAAVWLVPLLLPVGILVIWGLLPDLAALRTLYGGFLLAKVVGFCGVILLAAFNRLRVVPALATGEAFATRRFQRVLVAEYAGLGGVLATTATMTSLFSWGGA